MQIYLVGGAVRDQLLGYPIKERDWVVVGATPAQLLAEGYRQVGRDFPVFLHPETGEEYALARMERKSAPGYYGFECDYDPSVTLEEDLKRRDLTINAMAMDAHHKLIDPYHGMRDLKNKMLRHVSDAFVEDPVRVLRVARFAARYHHLGFRLADETRLLMYTMVKKGELDHLVPERIWQELNASLQERNPEIFIITLRQCGALSVLFPELDRLFGVPNPLQYHPEIDSGVHTMMVLQAAVQLSTDPCVRFAALVHDLGKGITPMADWPKHHDHDRKGMPIIDALCQRLKAPVLYRELATLVSCYHLTIHRLFELKSKTIVSVFEKTDAFRRPERFADLLIACEADGGSKKNKAYQQAAVWHQLLQRCTTISAEQFVKQGMQGLAIKDAMHEARVGAVKQFWISYDKK